VHLQKAVEFLGYKNGDYPCTEQAVSQILSLPMYAELTDDEIKYVADSINAFFKK
jgi:dTDP-4-amino-4,6-dideoxygalactose transaminase